VIKAIFDCQGNVELHGCIVQYGHVTHVKLHDHNELLLVAIDVRVIIRVFAY
jgi:hypothetical protein